MKVKVLTMQEVTQLISSVGFPIVAYLLMVFKQDKSLESLKTSIDNNTKAIEILLVREKVSNGKVHNTD